MAGKRQQQPIGVDIGRHRIKMAQAARRDDGSWSIAASASRDIPRNLAEESPERGAFIVTAISEMRTEAGFVGNTCISSLPAGTFEYKNVQMPQMPPSELAVSLSWEAAKRLGLDRSQVRQAYYDAGEISDGDEKRREVVLMAAPNAALEEHVSLLSRAGLRPIRVDAVPTALARAVAAILGADDDTPRLVVDLGYDAAKVLIVRGTQVQFYKNIDVGTRAIDQAVSETLSVSMDEAAAKRTDDASDAQLVEARQRAVKELAAEISLCLRYYSVTFHAERPGELLLTGGWANDQTVVEQLAKAMNIPTRRLGAGADGQPNTAITLSFGLSLGERAATGRQGAAQSHCFLPDSFVKRAARRAVYQRYAVALVAMVLAMVGLGMQKVNEMRSLSSELAGINQQVSSMQAQVTELNTLREEHKALAADVLVYERLKLPITTTSIVSAVSHLTPDSVGLEELTVVMPRLTAAHLTAAKASAKPASLPFVSIKLAGVAPSEVVLAEVVRRLTEHPLFSEVEVGFIQPTAVGLYAAREFQVSAKVQLDRDFQISETVQEVAHVDPE